MVDLGEPAPHLCRLHEEEPLMFVCLTEACLAQGLLCFQCRADKHTGAGHVIKNIDQLRKEATNMAYEKSAPDNVREHAHFLKDARQKCLVSIRETRRKLDRAFEEAERSANIRFDQLEEEASKCFENAGEARFQPPSLNMHLPTGELNQNAIDSMREIVSRKSKGEGISNLKKETIAAVQKSEKHGLEELPKL